MPHSNKDVGVVTHGGDTLGLRVGAGGGGQFQEAIQKILEMEQKPIIALDARRKQIEAKQKNFGTFKKAFSDLQGTLYGLSSVKALREFKVDLGDGKNLMDVQIDKDRAQPGSYEIEIEQLARKSAIITNGFSDPEEKLLGMGYVTVKGPESNFEIFIDENQGSLRDVTNIINSYSEAPVKATLIRDEYEPDRPWKMILSAKKDGEDDSLYFPEFYFLNGKEDLWIDSEQEAQNGWVFVDGFEIDTAGNKVPDFIQGVNIELKDSAPGKKFTLNITPDYEKVSGKIGELINKINGVLKFVKDQNTVDESTNTNTMFTGDTNIQTVEYRLRNLIHEGFTVGTEDNPRRIFMHDVGIQFNREGLLEFDTNKLAAALQADFENIAEAVSGEFGFVDQLKEVISGYTRPVSGMLATKEQAFRSQINDIDNQIATKERLLTQRAEALTQQFARLQSNISSMQQQQQYMASTIGSGGGLLSQLLG